MEQNKMTPTPWNISSDKENSELWIEHEKVSYVIASLFCEPLDDQTRADAHAIVTAVNSTYGAEINPEAVKDIRDTLKAILNIQLNGGDLSDLQHYDLLQEAKAAIEKSKL